MKLIIFGTGNYYRKYSKWFMPENIVAVIDNDEKKQGTFIDGHLVQSPLEVCQNDYDLIIILSLHEKEMKKQLIKLGVESDKIVGYASLHEYRKLIKTALPTSLILTDSRVKSFLKSMDLSNTILLMSHTLDFSGATLALYYAVNVLVSANYNVVFASWNDGPLKETLFQNGIPVIIEPNLEMCTANEISWVNQFNKIICNTLNYYYFLSDRRKDAKYIWWLHDPEIFYETLNQDVFSKIEQDGLTICAAGKIAEKAIKHHMKDVNVHQLIYGIPKAIYEPYCHPGSTGNSKKIMIAVIANVQNYKGQDILIDALNTLTEEEREFFHVKIVGNIESVYASLVQKKASVLGDIVEFTGQIGREKVYSVLDTIDLLICPSRVDTMSVSCSEAMQRGIPCLVSNAVGMAEYIEDGKSGLIFRNEDVSNLAEKLRWCANNRKGLKKIGLNGREIYDRFFSMKAFEVRFMEIVKMHLDNEC